MVGGTGFPVDIDEFDTMEDAYRQLIVWSPEDEQILGGYRFLCGSDVKFDENGKPMLATSHLFNFFGKSLIKSSFLIRSSWAVLSLPWNISLHVPAQKRLFVLDNLWDGLGALSVVDPSLQYYFGR